MKKFKNIQNKIIEKISSWGIIIFLIIIWELLSISNVIPKFMLPSPIDVIEAFIKDFPLLVHHMKITLIEAFLGLFLGIILGFLVAFIMENNKFLYRSIYPVLVISQTIPTVAIAPLLVLWLGYGLLPKITLVVLTSFFPITIGLLDGFKSVDEDMIKLMKTMGASKFQIFKYIKLPNSIGYFFSGLRISVSYSIIGAVVAEWLGGFDGLGVYMTRVRKSYSFDKMFAVIFIISIMSIILMSLVKVIQRKSMPWENRKEE